MSDKNRFKSSIPLVLIEKAEGEDAGDGNSVKAMVTSWNDPDLGQDVFAANSFDKFLKEFKKAGNPLQMQIGHDSSTVSGEWHTFTKTEKGLIGEGTIFDDLEDGKRAKKLLERNIIKSVSIGISSKKWNFNDNGGRDFAEASLREVSLVTHPQNPSASVLSVKSEQPESTILDRITKAIDDKITANHNQTIVAHIDKAIANMEKNNV